MKKTNIKNPVEDFKSLSDDHARFYDLLVASNELYEMVLSMLNIEEDDNTMKTLMRGVLERQTRNQITLGIWKNISDEDAVHLRELLNSSSITDPGLSTEDVMIKFVLIRPEFLEKVHRHLAEYFIGFVQRFNEQNPL